MNEKKLPQKKIEMVNEKTNFSPKINLFFACPVKFNK